MQAGVSRLTRQQVSWELFDRALKIPGFEFIDAAGRKWSNKSYFDMLARTELMNAGRASCDDKCAQEGFDLMILTTSGDSCDKCARFEGKLFSLSGEIEGVPSKQDLIDAGVFHPNCTHSYSFVPDYVAETKYGIKVNRKGEKQQPEPKVKEEPATKPETKPVAKPEKKPEAKPETKPEIKPEAKPIAKLVAKPETKPVAKPETKPAAKPEAKPNPPAGKETRAERRQKQREIAYDSRRDEWRQSILNAGGSRTVADELADAYTMEVARLGKPPRVTFRRNVRPYYNDTQKTIVLEPDPKTEYGSAFTALHEFGHWIDYRTRFARKSNREAALERWKELDEAAKKDLELFKEKAGANLKSFKRDKTGKSVLALAEKIFGKKYHAMNDDERDVVCTYADMAGSISDGLYGFGHEPKQYAGFRYSEAVANAYAAYRNREAFRRIVLDFPNIIAYIEMLLKGVK